MEIEKLTINDYNDVYQLWISTPGMGLNTIDDSREGIERYLERNPDTCFVARIYNKIVGVILCGHDGRRGYIHHTAVNISYRTQGIGRKLVECAITALQNEGISKVACVVFEKNKEGNLFWEKIGFCKRDDLIYRNKTISKAVLKRIDT